MGGETSRSIQYASTLLVLRELALASLVIAPSRNNIEQEVLLLLADEYRPTCSFSMTNPGSLAMGFAEADPCQLAPSVGTTQVRITISAVPSSANHNSRARARSNPLEEFKFTTNISIT